MAKYQIGNIKITKELLSEKIGIELKDRQIQNFEVRPARSNTSPFSSFYEIDITLNDGTTVPLFVKDISDERKKITDKLPASGKLVESEIRFLELSDGNGYTPKLYGTIMDSVKGENGGNIGHTQIFLGRFDESLEDYLFRLNPEDPDAKNEALLWIKKSIDTIMAYCKVAKEGGHTRDNEDKLQVYTITKQNLENEIRQAFHNMLFYGYGKGSSSLTKSQSRSMVNWIEKYDYKKFIGALIRHIAKPLSPTEEDISKEGEDRRPLYVLDIHPGQFGINKKEERVVLIDGSRFGHGPLSLVPASFFSHPSSFGKFSQEDIEGIGDYTFEQYERVVERTDSLDFAEKRRFDSQIPSASRYLLARVGNYVASLNTGYPECGAALAQLHKEWEGQSCLVNVLTQFISLDDGLALYLEAEGVNDVLRSLLNSSE